MIKSELVQRMAARNPHLYQRDIENIVDAILGEIADALARGERVELRGFGAFSTKQRQARTGRNPRTGDKVPVTEKLVPFFKTGKEMRERLNVKPLELTKGPGAVCAAGALAALSLRRERRRRIAHGSLSSKLVVIVPIAIALLAFAFANRQIVTVSFDPLPSGDVPAFAVSLPLFVVLILTAMLGVVAGGVAVWFAQGRHRRAARRSAPRPTAGAPKPKAGRVRLARRAAAVTRG